MESAQNFEIRVTICYFLFGRTLMKWHTNFAGRGVEMNGNIENRVGVMTPSVAGFHFPRKLRISRISKQIAPQIRDMELALRYCQQSCKFWSKIETGTKQFFGSLKNYQENNEQYFAFNFLTTWHIFQFFIKQEIQRKIKRINFRIYGFDFSTNKVRLLRVKYTQ